MRPARAFAGWGCVLLALACASAPAAEATFSSLDGTPLKAHYFFPAGAPKGTVIALHGCGGLYATAGKRQGELNARHRAMADMLVAQGYVAVFPDSFTPRGETEICTQRFAARDIDQKQRRADALAAVAWADSQPWAAAGRIALLGWSHGGSAVLAATDAGNSSVKVQAVRPVVAIAFYPGCSASLKSGYRASTKLVILIGEKDDWTPPEPCLALGRAAHAEVVTYPDSYHDFDNPGGRVQVRRDVPNGVRPGEGVHAGANPAAREQANQKVRELLHEAFR